MLTGSQCFSVDSCLFVQAKLWRKVDDRVQYRRCGSYYGPVWSSVMVNWMKAASYKLMGMDVRVVCQDSSRSRHLTAVKELRCMGVGGCGGGGYEVLLLKCLLE